MLFRRSFWETSPKVDPGTFSFLQPGWISWHLLAIPLVFLAGRASRADRLLK